VGKASLYNDLPVDLGRGTGGITILSINDVPQTPPSVSCTATLNILWPPNGKDVSVTAAGSVTPGSSALATWSEAFSITDSEGSVQPSGTVSVGTDGNYSFAIPLLASRTGDDKNGREYTILVTAVDGIGNMGSCSVVVTVPHDQR